MQKRFLYFVVTELNVYFSFLFGQIVGNLISVHIVWSLTPTFTYPLLPPGLGLTLGCLTGCHGMGRARRTGGIHTGMNILVSMLPPGTVYPEAHCCTPLVHNLKLQALPLLRPVHPLECRGSFHWFCAKDRKAIWGLSTWGRPPP